MTSCDPYGPENITFLPNLTLGHVTCLIIGFFGRRVDCAHQIWISSHQMASKWPLNDLKWPIRTWKHSFLTKSHFGACNMSFYRFFWTPSWLHLSDLNFESPNDLQMTSNDLKWPIRTWKHNFLPKSHFGACNMSFHRFFWTPSWLRSSDLNFESPNDLKMTSKWPQVTHKDLKT